MVPFIPFIIILPVVGFWVWMFWDMASSPGLPRCFVTFTGGNNSRLDWTIAFIIFNALAAGYYYLAVYRNRRLF